jgi:hypothetical protein
MLRLDPVGRAGLVLATLVAGCALDAPASESTGAAGSALAVDFAAIAARFAPVVYFDQVVPGDSGKQSKCLPQSAEPYYVARLRGDRGRICNQDASSLGGAPSYYEVDMVGDSVFVTYWFFYGYQSTCFADAGGHDSDWERITVRVVSNHLRDVVYWQHDGRYTRRADTIHTEGEHPVAYSGKNAHGSYHDTGGSGGCAYFEDYRNPGSRNLKWETWRNLKDIGKGEETWMHAAPDTDGLWQGPEPPTHRGRSVDEGVCREDAGRVKLGSLTLSATNTCKRSDYGDSGLRIRDLAAPPWRHPDCADAAGACSGPRACFFTDSDGRGGVACYPAGDYGWVGSDLNDRFSSVRFFGGAQVTLYEHAWFGGKTRVLASDVGNFKSLGFNDAVSSLGVRAP